MLHECMGYKVGQGGGSWDYLPETEEFCGSVGRSTITSVGFGEMTVGSRNGNQQNENNV